MKIIAIFIIIYAVLDIISTLAIKSSVTKIKKAMEETIADAEIISEDDNVIKNKKQKNKKAKKNKN